MIEQYNKSTRKNMATKQEWSKDHKEYLEHSAQTLIKSWEAIFFHLASKCDEGSVKAFLYSQIEMLLIDKLRPLSHEAYLKELSDYIHKATDRADERANIVNQHLGSMISDFKSPLCSDNVTQLKQKLVEIEEEAASRWTAPHPSKSSSAKIQLIEDSLETDPLKVGYCEPALWASDCRAICRRIDFQNHPMVPCAVAMTDPFDKCPTYFIGSHDSGLRHFKVDRAQTGSIILEPVEGQSWTNSLKKVKRLAGLARGGVFQDFYGFLKVMYISPHGKVGWIDMDPSSEKRRFQTFCAINIGKALMIAGVPATSTGQAQTVQIYSMAMTGGEHPTTPEKEEIRLSAKDVKDLQPELWATFRGNGVTTFYLLSIKAEEKQFYIHAINKPDEGTLTQECIQEVVKRVVDFKGQAHLAVSETKVLAVISPTSTSNKVSLFRESAPGQAYTEIGTTEIKGTREIKLVKLKSFFDKPDLELLCVTRDCQAFSVALSIVTGPEGQEKLERTTVTQMVRFSQVYEVVDARLETGVTSQNKAVLLLSHKRAYGDQSAIIELSFN